MPLKIQLHLPTLELELYQVGVHTRAKKRFLINGINGQSKVVCVRLIELYFGSYVMD